MRAEQQHAIRRGRRAALLLIATPAALIGLALQEPPPPNPVPPPSPAAAYARDIGAALDACPAAHLVPDLSTPAAVIASRRAIEAQCIDQLRCMEQYLDLISPLNPDTATPIFLMCIKKLQL